MFELRHEHTLRRIEEKIDQLLKQGEKIMADLTALTAAVTNNTQVEASAVTLIQGLASQLAAVATDPVAVAALAQQINDSATALAAAITTNTPAATAPSTNTFAQAQANPVPAPASKKP